MTSTTDAAATDARAPAPASEADSVEVTLVDVPVQPLRTTGQAGSGSAALESAGSPSAALESAASGSAESGSAASGSAASGSAASGSIGAPGLIARARADGVTGPAVVVLATAVVALGVAADLRLASGLSFGTVVSVLVAAVAAPAVVRFRSLATAAVLPPLLMAGAAAAIGRLSDQDHGNRELALDVGTTLALWAPALFAATVAGLLVVLIRVGHRIIR